MKGQKTPYRGEVGTARFHMRATHVYCGCGMRWDLEPGDGPSITCSCGVTYTRPERRVKVRGSE